MRRSLNSIMALLGFGAALLLPVGCSTGEGGTKEDKANTADFSVPALVEADASTMNAVVEIRFTDFDALERLHVTRISTPELLSASVIEKSDITSPHFLELAMDDYRLPNTVKVRIVAESWNGSFSEIRTVTVVRPVLAGTLSLDTHSVVPDAGGNISARLAISGYTGPAAPAVYAEVRSGMGVLHDQMELHPGDPASFPFDYTVDADMPDFLEIAFSIVGQDGFRRSEPVVLKVDRRSEPTIGAVECISRVTGMVQPGENTEGSPYPRTKFTIENETDRRYDVGGTDLGIVWEISDGNYGLFFGDTFGSSFVPNPANPGPNGGNWRSNVLLFSTDTDLSDGLDITSAAMDGLNNYAREIAAGGKDGSGTGDWTSIPTAAVRANGASYLHYMNIRNWTGWVINHAALYRSLDNGINWSYCEGVRFATDSNFGQVGYFAAHGYVYMVGTHSGREGIPCLARFLEENIERQSEYEYWDGANWIKGRERSAVPLFDDKAGELSVAYNDRLGKWIMLYFNGPRYEITMRTADEITGPWSEPQTAASGWDYPQLYGSYIHPLCLDGDKLYFIMSMWMPYNTYLMCADLI